jgi:RNA polymerase sigma factor for flagellar operon FliA
LKEIGEVLSVSESRVSQISSQAMLRLRARLSEWVDEDAELLLSRE